MTVELWGLGVGLRPCSSDVCTAAGGGNPGTSQQEPGDRRSHCHQGAARRRGAERRDGAGRVWPKAEGNLGHPGSPASRGAILLRERSQLRGAAGAEVGVV